VVETFPISAADDNSRRIVVQRPRRIRDDATATQFRSEVEFSSGDDGRQFRCWLDNDGRAAKRVTAAGRGQVDNAADVPTPHRPSHRPAVQQSGLLVSIIRLR